MKKILITGASSYIGKSLENWLGAYTGAYSVESISLRSESWKERDFSEYEVIFHVAGIAHQKENKQNANLYYSVNRDLAKETAIKAKKDGVHHFIFLSSMSVYGIENGVISESSPLNPKSHYGNSKLQAEELISALEDDFFKVAIIRPPMVYGRGCKGNYPRLSNLSLKTPMFPNLKNKRSMIYIDNLCEFIRLIIEHGSRGIYYPQNAEYVCTSNMVELINLAHGREIWMTNLFNGFLRLSIFRTLNKVFGNLIYEKELSKYKENYCVYSFDESIKLAENVESNGNVK